MKFAISNIVLLVIIFFTSCQDQYNICEQNKFVEARAGFYQKSGTLDILTAPQQLSFGVLGSSTLLYNQISGVSTINFALNPGIDSAKFYVKTAVATQADTVTIFYTSQSIILSPECGNVNYFQLNNAKTTLNTLDSVKIINASVNNVAVENIKIYF